MTDTSHSALEPSDKANLDEARAWVKGHFTDSADEKYSSIDGKLRVLDTILRRKWVEPAETIKLQSLGVAFGDAISQALMLEWVVVNDEYGRSPALNWPGTSLCIYPLTMISKRVEDGEEVDVYDLFEGICNRLKEIAFSGQAT